MKKFIKKSLLIMLIGASGTAHASLGGTSALKGLVSGGKTLLNWAKKQITVQRVIAAGVAGTAIYKSYTSYCELKRKSFNNLYTVMIENSIKTLQQLLTGPTAYLINTRDFDGYTPLLVAVDNNYLNIAQLLLQHGAEESINTPENNKQTPLLVAAFRNNLEMVQLLLQHGAQGSINISSNNDLTPLFCATGRNNLEMIQLLLENGADPAIQCNGLDLQTYTTNEEIKTLLRVPKSVWTYNRLTEKLFTRALSDLSEEEQTELMTAIQDETFDLDHIKELLKEITNWQQQPQFVHDLFKIALQEYIKKGGVLDDLKSYGESKTLLMHFYEYYRDEKKLTHLLALYIQSGQPLQINKGLGYGDSWINDGDHDETGRILFDASLSLRKKAMLIKAHEMQLAGTNFNLTEIINVLTEAVVEIKPEVTIPFVKQLKATSNPSTAKLLFQVWLMQNFLLDEDDQLIIRDEDDFNDQETQPILAAIAKHLSLMQQELYLWGQTIKIANLTKQLQEDFTLQAQAAGGARK